MTHPLDQIADVGRTIATKDWIKLGPCPDPHPSFRAALKAHIFEEVERLKNTPDAKRLGQRIEQEGGWKVRDSGTWSRQEARWIMGKVLTFVREQFSVAEAHIRDRWANVMEAGTCSAPHAHSNADIAVVYMLDRGRPDQDLTTPGGFHDAGSDESGRFGLMDPRIAECCPTRPGYPTAEIIPIIPEQSFIAFPGSLIHWVSKFNGSQPRITMAFNVRLGAPPENFDPSDLEAPVVYQRDLSEF